MGFRMLHGLRALGKGGLAYALGLTAGLIASFGSTGPAGAQMTKVGIGITNTATDVGFFIADKKGYFRDAGIAVTMTPFASAARMIAPLGTGQLDVGAGTVAAGLYNAVERGILIRIVADKGSIADGYEYSTLLIRKDLVDSGRFKSLADLKGMTVATAAPGSGSESSLNEALKKGGLKFADVNVVYMGFPEQLAAYRNKGIDAGVTNEPTVTRTIRDGFAVRASRDAIYPGQQTAVVLYSENFAGRRPLAQNFMNAYLRAVREYNGALKDGRLAGPNAAEIISILTEYTAVKNAETYGAMTAFAVNPDGHVNAASLKNDLAFFKERALVGGKVSVEQVIDNSFAEQAVRVLGAYRQK
jgi:NitT/TauT family transport system substrate-binding protein